MAAMRQFAFLILTVIVENVAAETHCLPSEKVIFNCELAKSQKIASVCASSTLTVTEGYLQYRFGRRGKLELTYPSTKTQTQKKFYWSQIHPYQSFITQLSFKNGKYLYTLAMYGISEELNDIPGGADFAQIEIANIGTKAQPVILNCDAYTGEGMWQLGEVVNYGVDAIAQ